MTADGDWNVVVVTPLGERQGVLSLKTDGATLRGSQSADGGSTEIFDGVVNGASLAWKINITDPMPLTLTFNGSVEGDRLNGTVTLGDFGESTFSAERLDARA